MSAPELLLVDAYNVLMATDRYANYIDELADSTARESSSGAKRAIDVHGAPVAHGSLAFDPYERAREVLVADVAAYAQGRYEAVVVFDGSGNVSSEREALSRAGIEIMFSHFRESADAVIERLATQARSQGRKVTVVTSDNTVRSSVGQTEVRRISSQMFVNELMAGQDSAASELEDRTHARMTIEDRLDPKQRAALNRLLGRS